MEISDDDMELITRLIIEKVGTDVSPEMVSSLALEAALRLSQEQVEHMPAEADSEQVESPTRGMKKLIVNAFGFPDDRLEQNLRTFAASRNLGLSAISSTVIDEYQSLIAVIDYTPLESDINLLKFEISELCQKFGFKTIVQDSDYYRRS